MRTRLKDPGRQFNMRYSLSGMLLAASGPLVLLVLILGSWYRLKPLPLTVITMVVALGSLGLVVLNRKLIRMARNELNEFLQRTDRDPEADKPVCPVELEEFMEFVVDSQGQARKARSDASLELSDNQKWVDIQSRCIEALSSELRVASRLENLTSVLQSSLRLAAGGYYEVHSNEPPTRLLWTGEKAPLPMDSFAGSTLEKDLLGGRMVWVERLAVGPELLVDYALANKFISAIFVPAVADPRRTIGFLVLFSTEARLQTPRLAALMEALRTPLAKAQQSGAAAEKQLEDSFRAQKVNDLFLSLGTCKTLEEAAAALLERVREYQAYRSGALLLLDTPDSFQVVATRSDAKGYFLGARLRKEGSCAAFALDQGKFRLDADIRQAPKCVEDGVLCEEGYVSRLVYPLYSGGRPFGCLYLGSNSLESFGSARAEYLSVPLQLVGAILENFRGGAADAVEASAEQADVQGDGAAEKVGVLARITHEIRSQLKSVLDVAERLAGGQGGAVEAGQIVGQSRELLGMLDGVLDMERLGFKELKMQEFNVNEAIAEIGAELQPLLAGRAQSAIWEAPRSLPPIIADIAHFSSVICRLMEHAVSVTPQGGQVAFRANLIPASWLKERPTDFLPEAVAKSIVTGTNLMIFSIVDQGEALTPEARDRVFLPTASSLSDAESVKLMVVRRLVSMHRGHVWMEEGPGGRGNRVVVVLPQYSVDEVAFMNYLGQRVARARDTMANLSLITIGYKDRQQMRESVGDEAFLKSMKELESTVKRAIREPLDSLRRYGKGELVVVFAEADRNGASRIVERVQKRHSAEHEGNSTEIVWGVVSFPEDAVRSEDLLKQLETRVGV